MPITGILTRMKIGQQWGVSIVDVANSSRRNSNVSKCCARVYSLQQERGQENRSQV